MRAAAWSASSPATCKATVITSASTLRKGVILATGGYGNNLEMMEARQPWNQKMRISIGRNGTGGNPTGDGIKAALWARRPRWTRIGAACMFNRACRQARREGGRRHRWASWWWFGEQPVHEGQP